MKLTPDTAYIIWSHKHKLWWGPDECGYVQNFIFAGIYSQEWADAIVARTSVIRAERSEAHHLASFLASEYPWEGTVLQCLREIP